MKFSWKVFFSTIVIVMIAFGVGGYFIISSVFDSALAREINLSLEENQLMRYSFETAVASLPEDYDPSMGIIRNIGKTLDTGNIQERTLLRISDDSYTTLYANKDLDFDKDLLAQAMEGNRAYRLINEQGLYWVQSVCMIHAGSQTVYLESVRNISAIFEERNQHYHIYRRLLIGVLCFDALLIYLLSLWLTRPIRDLSSVTRRIAEGNYDRRAKVTSHDEIGALTQDFNAMADALENKIHDLEAAARSQEDFVASFAHELKTPLTSIIGYADALRSYDMEPEERFEWASYIFSEGKRLESLSLKLMEMIVLRREDFEWKEVHVGTLLKEIKGILYPLMKEKGLQLEIGCESAIIQAEPDLIKTLLFNLIDNARKASVNGGKIQVQGEREGKGFCFMIKDYGVGIPEEELSRITEAFYMVDKSRSRAQNGAGLGLALCSEIVKLHHGRLEFHSKLHEGTIVMVHLGGE